MPTRCSVLLAGCLLLAPSVGADVVTLRSGGTIDGNVVRETDDAIEVRVRFGKVTVPRANVLSIVECPTDEEIYDERAAAVPDGDAHAHLALADWARARDLRPEAIRHYVAAHALDPSLARAAAVLESLDWHFVEGNWLDPETWYSRIGWVRWGNRWAHPLEVAWHEAREGAEDAGRQLRRSRERLEESEEEVARAIATANAAGREPELVAGRALDAAVASGAAEQSVAAAGAARDRARLELERARAVYELERTRAEHGEPHRLDLAQLELDRAAHAAACARNALRDAERALGAARSNQARARAEAEREARLAADADSVRHRAEQRLREAQLGFERAEEEAAAAQEAEEQAERAWREVSGGN